MRNLIIILLLAPLALFAQKKKDNIAPFILDSAKVKQMIRTARVDNQPDSIKGWVLAEQVTKTIEAYSKTTNSQAGTKKKLGEFPAIFDVYEKRVDSTITGTVRPGKDTTFKIYVTRRKPVFVSAIVPPAVLKNPKQFFDNKFILFVIKD